MRVILLFATLLVLVVTASAQYSVKLTIQKGDPQLQTKIRNAVQKELSAFSDIKIQNKAKFELKINALSRTLSDGSIDHFISIVSIANTFCVVERDSSGRVISSTECQELLTSDSYVGRDSQIEPMIKEFIADFNASVIEPLRDIARGD